MAIYLRKIIGRVAEQSFLQNFVTPAPTFGFWTQNSKFQHFIIFVQERYRDAEHRGVGVCVG